MSRSAEQVRTGHPVRFTLACLLVVLACLLTPVAVTAAWARDEVADTDRFVAALAPLSGNTAVQDAVSARLATAAVQAVDVGGLTDSLREALGLGPNNGSGPVSGSLQSLLAGVADQAAQAFVASDAFTVIWRDALRIAHASALDALEGKDSGTVSTTNGEVVLDLGPMIDQVRQGLVGRGFAVASNIPDIDRRYVLVHREGLRTGQDAFRFLDTAGTWLPIVVVVLFVLGVCLAPRRRPALLWAGVGTALTLLALGIMLAVARRTYLDDLPPEVSRDAAAAVYDALVSFLRRTTRTLGVAAVALAIAAFVAGPARPAGTIRRAFVVAPDRAGAALARHGFGTGSVGVFVAAHRGPVYAVTGLLGGIWLCVWNEPTVWSVLLIVVVVVAVVAVLEAVAAAGTRREVETAR
ncbi:hypothetical protein [Embleya sp. NPDC059237]|uniref:hypothetical protein n=1 Tax=Embleya sp. NPDC059237 TaxID=3346784 RepID=UPI0036A54DCB